MKDEAAELLTNTINEMKAAGKNHQEIATDLIGGAIAVLVDSIGTLETANFLHTFAARIESESDLDNVIN